MKLTLASIARDVGGMLWRGQADALVRGVSTDSRNIPAGALFVALRGPNFDGHDFLRAAAEAGAAAALVANDAPELAGTLPIIVAPHDTLRALGDLAHAWRMRHRDVRVVAITGSAGKTTTKEMVASVLADGGPTLATVGNLNNLIGVPQTLFRLTVEHRYAVIEMGMNAFGEIGRMAAITRPHVGLITLVAAAHTEGVGGIEGVARAKGELWDALSAVDTAVVNVDDEHLVARAADFRGHRVTFGRAQHADVHLLGEPVLTLEGTRVEVSVRGHAATVTLPQVGVHQAMNAAAAMACTLALGTPLETMVHGLARAGSVAGRMSVRRSSERGLTVLDDTYNANPRSVAMALETVASLAAQAGARAIAVLGDMRELGMESAAQHLALGHAAAGRVAALYTLGTESAHTAAAARAAGLSAVVHELDFEALCAKVLHDVRPGDLVLVKGSRGMRMERFVAALLGADAPTGAH